MGLNHTVNPLLNIYPIWEVVFSLDKIIRERYFHHLDVTLKGHPIICPLKQKDLFDYNPRCLMSSGMMYNAIIMNMIRNKKLECHEEEVDFFLQILRIKTFMYRGALQDF